jgi:hypothetical protein
MVEWPTIPVVARTCPNAASPSLSPKDVEKVQTIRVCILSTLLSETGMVPHG